MMNRQEAKPPSREPSAEVDRIASAIVDSALCVHKELGPGLIESVYETCLVHELRARDFRVETQVVLPVKYREIRLDAGLRLDMVVGDAVVVEIKAIEALLPVHTAQVMTYLKLSGYRLGLLINFNVPLIRDGIRRIIS